MHRLDVAFEFSFSASVNMREEFKFHRRLSLISLAGDGLTLSPPSALIPLLPQVKQDSMVGVEGRSEQVRV